MGIQYQVLIAFAALVVVAALIALLWKKQRLAWVLAGLVVIASAVGVWHAADTVLKEYRAEKSAKAEEIMKEQNAETYLKIASALIATAHYDEAEKMLDSFARDALMTNGYMLAQARLDASVGNYVNAAGIYSQLITDGASHLSAEVLNREYAVVSAAAKGEKTQEEVQQSIYEGITEEDFEPEDVALAEDIVVSGSLDIEEGDPDTAFELVEHFIQLEKAKPFLFQYRPFRIAYYKCLYIIGRYDDIIGHIEDFNDPATGYILAEICRTGKLTNRILRSNKRLENRANDYAAILEWVRAERERGTLSDTDLAIFDTAEDELSAAGTNNKRSYSSWVMEKLREIADGGDPEASKLYLELARMYFDQNNEDAASAYLRLALISAGNNDDIAYTGPINELNDILGDKSDTERLKQIDQYVQQMVENRVPLELRAGDQRNLSWDDLNFSGLIADTLGKSQSELWGDYEHDGSWVRPADPEAEYSSNDEFSDFATADVNQITASVTIASIDSSAFENVSAIIAIDESIARDPEQFREHVRILDCDAEIDNYTVEKLEDMGVNIILVCDNSGSMSDYGNIYNLKDALQSFVDNLAPDVNCGIVAFSYGVIDRASCPDGSSPADIRQAIDNMYADGGTDIRSGVYAALEQLSAGEKLNIIIVMSDGQDYGLSDSDKAALRAACLEKDVVIYSMGLGNGVDSGVLSGYSEAGGGQYTFVTDSGTLLSFYQNIYNISRNRFRITYKAIDTIHDSRTLQVINRDDTKVNDRRRYSLLSGEVGGDDGDDYIITLENMSLSGLDTRLIYKSGADQTIRLLGNGLTSDHNITVSIRSALSYDLACEYESDTAWKITVPANVACGDYDVIVTVDGRRAVFNSALVVTDGKTHTSFGSGISLPGGTSAFLALRPAPGTEHGKGGYAA